MGKKGKFATVTLMSVLLLTGCGGNLSAEQINEMNQARESEAAAKQQAKDDAAKTEEARKEEERVAKEREKEQELAAKQQELADKQATKKAEDEARQREEDAKEAQKQADKEVEASAKAAEEKAEELESQAKEKEQQDKEAQKQAEKDAKQQEEADKKAASEQKKAQEKADKQAKEDAEKKAKEEEERIKNDPLKGTAPDLAERTNKAALAGYGLNGWQEWFDQHPGSSNLNGFISSMETEPGNSVLVTVQLPEKDFTAEEGDRLARDIITFAGYEVHDLDSVNVYSADGRDRGYATRAANPLHGILERSADTNGN